MLMKKTAVVLTITLSFFSLLKAEGDENEYVQRILSAFESVKQRNPNITDETVLATWEETNIGTAFNCELLPEPPPAAENVHELKPYDIQVVGALGDSITAGFGAKARTLLTVSTNYRGVAWSIGGDEDLDTVTTLPNIIKNYNPNVKGFSIGTGSHTSANARLNVAISGAIAQGLPEQARTLIAKIKEDQEIDFENDWKLVTLWIGGNNLCDYCRNKDKNSVSNYLTSIQDTLDILHEELPRTFVNMVQIIDITRLAPLSDNLICGVIHLFACPCSKDSETSQKSTEYQEAVNDLIASGRYNTRDDFTVVIQPFFIGVEIPLLPDGKPDSSYFAPDCFHFSVKGHKEGAIALWDNMIQPVGCKSTNWEVGGDITCPSEEFPYFYTSENSPEHCVVQYLSKNLADSQNHNSYATIVTTVVVLVSISLCIAVLVIILALLRKRRQLKMTESSEHTALLIK